MKFSKGEKIYLALLWIYTLNLLYFFFRGQLSKGVFLALLAVVILNITVLIISKKEKQIKSNRHGE